MDWLSELIGNYAFPIVCTVALFIENRDQRKTHKEESASLTAVLEQNTIALTKLTDRITDMEEHNK